MLPRVKAMGRRVVPRPLYRRYRQHKVASLITSYHPHDVTHDYGGCSLRIHLADPLAAGWYDHDWDEIAVFRFLRERGVLVPRATVLDLGAHQGVVALMLADKVGEAGRVIAVEAEPHNARVAERNRELNEAENLIVVHAAGAASEGVISFSEGLNGRIGGEAAEGHVDVPAPTIHSPVDPRHGQKCDSPRAGLFESQRARARGSPGSHDVVNQQNALSLDASRAERLDHILAARAIAETCLGRRRTHTP